jgi:hypothetical protein
VLDIAERAPVRLEIAAPDGGPDLVVGENLHLSAHASTAVGDPLDAGQGIMGVQWHSLRPAVAEVSPSGIVRAKAVGRTTIVATLGALTARYAIAVRVNPVATLRILAAAPARVGDVVVLRAEPRGANGQRVGGVRVRWSVTGAGAEMFPDGRLVARVAGTYPVTASVGNRVASGAVQILPRRDTRWPISCPTRRCPRTSKAVRSGRWATSSTSRASGARCTCSTSPTPRRPSSWTRSPSTRGW